MNNDRIPTRGRAPFVSGACVLSAVALLSGCVGSPTYGTGKPASQQLLEDVSGALTLGTPNRAAEIAYRPRPELVKPASLDVLPEPQQELASAENPAWPESPEQRRARIRAEATANQDNSSYRGALASGRNDPGYTYPNKGVPDADLTPQRREEFHRRLRENNQGEPTARRYLSEPPLDYRRPAETAAVGEMGEDERTKERRLRQASGKSSWRDYLPW